MESAKESQLKYVPFAQGSNQHKDQMTVIEKICFRVLQIPLKFQFAQSNNPSSIHSSSVLLELISQDGISGFGESCPRTYVTGEDMTSVLEDLKNCASIVTSWQLEDLQDLQHELDELEKRGIGASTICALELACLDLIGKSSRQNWQQLFGIKTTPELSYSLILPLLPAEKFTKLLEIEDRIVDGLREGLVLASRVSSEY